MAERSPWANVPAHEPDHPRSHREIAFRENDGIEVALLWAPEDDGVVVAVIDTKANHAFEMPVERHRALHAFTHPFVYAAAAG